MARSEETLGVTGDAGEKRSGIDAVWRDAPRPVELLLAYRAKADAGEITEDEYELHKAAALKRVAQLPAQAQSPVAAPAFSASRSEPVSSRSAPAPASRFGFLLAAAAFAVLIAVAGVFWALSHSHTRLHSLASPSVAARPPSAATMSGPKLAAPAASAKVPVAKPVSAEPPAPVLTPRQKLARLRGEFFQQKNSGKGVAFTFPGQVAAFIDQTADTDDLKMEGYNLLTDAYYATGEAGQAKDSLAAYLDYCDKLKGVKESANQLCSRADSLYHRSDDYLSALSCYDLLRVRYPTSEQVPYAVYMVGQYYQHIRAHAQAAEAYKAVMDGWPNSKWAAESGIARAEALLGAGQKAAALDLLRQVADGTKDEDVAGRAQSQLAFLLYVLGRYPEAVKECRAFQERFPRHQLVGRAASLMKLMRDKTMDDIGKPGA